MKDKKFVVLCVLGLVWLLMFIGMLAGARIHPRVEILVWVICLGWFAYWTISTIRDYFRKPVAPTNPEPTTTPKSNGNKSKKS